MGAVRLPYRSPPRGIRPGPRDRGFPPRGGDLDRKACAAPRRWATYLPDRRRRSTPAAGGDPVAREPAVERAAPDPEQPRRLRGVAARLAQCPLERAALVGVQGEREVGGRRRGRGRAPSRAGEVGEAQQRARRERERRLERALELAHVAGPLGGGQRLERRV